MPCNNRVKQDSNAILREAVNHSKPEATNINWRFLFLAGIAAYDGGDALSSGFERPPRIVPHMLKGEK